MYFNCQTSKISLNSSYFRLSMQMLYFDLSYLFFIEFDLALYIDLLWNFFKIYYLFSRKFIKVMCEIICTRDHEKYSQIRDNFIKESKIKTEFFDFKNKCKFSCSVELLAFVLINFYDRFQFFKTFKHYEKRGRVEKEQFF